MLSCEAHMPFSIRPFRRFPVQCAVTHQAALLLKLPLAYCLSFVSAKPIEGGSYPAS
jgi:hypothetical protein